MKRSNKISSLRSAFVVFGFAVVTPLQAEISYSFNGFGTIAVGKVLTGDVAEADYVSYQCPCFITYYNNGGIYQENDS